jgi:hypothetical protein
MFFNREEFDLGSARAPTFALSPNAAMVEPLRRDYAAMQGMVFGAPPAFEAVMQSVADLETRLNQRGRERSDVDVMPLRPPPPGRSA